MLVVLEILGNSEAQGKRNHLYGKANGNGLGGPPSWVLWGIRESPRQANSVSQVDGNSDMVPTYWL